MELHLASWWKTVLIHRNRYFNAKLKTRLYKVIEIIYKYIIYDTTHMFTHFISLSQVVCGELGRRLQGARVESSWANISTSICTHANTTTPIANWNNRFVFYISFIPSFRRNKSCFLVSNFRIKVVFVLHEMILNIKQGFSGLSENQPSKLNQSICQSQSLSMRKFTLPASTSRVFMSHMDQHGAKDWGIITAACNILLSNMKTNHNQMSPGLLHSKTWKSVWTWQQVAVVYTHAGATWEL